MDHANLKLSTKHYFLCCLNKSNQKANTIKRSIIYTVLELLKNLASHFKIII